jgi:plastocyanin
MRTYLFLGVVGIVVAGCSSSSSSSSGNSSGGADGGGATTVTVSNFKFDPPELTIKAGDSVTWNFTGGTHNVTSGTNCTSDNKFASGAPKAAPNTFIKTFDTAGTFDYFCQPHCTSGMVGKIIVQ